MKEDFEKWTRTSGYYSAEEAGKALKKTIEEVNKKEYLIVTIAMMIKI